MKRNRHVFWTAALLTAVVLSLGIAGASAAPGAVAELSFGAARIDWQPVASYDRLVLTVSGPDGKVFRQELAAGAAPSFSLFDENGQQRPDGSYRYELVAAPKVDREVRRELAAARRKGDVSVETELQKAGKLPQGAVQSGSFAIQSGAFVAPDLVEERPGKPTPRNPRAGAGIGNITAPDQVIPDDLIVQQSLCVGFDCVNNESFGFDTIRLKENNTRIKFEDTSTGTFPTNDWQLTANDSASGGSSKFSIEDITGSRVPFTVTAGASTNSIFVDSTGRVGFRTSTPVLDLHVNTSNTPAIRLEQNNSGGFTAQTWDIGANEANFFVRDVTGGSKLSLRIRPGAPTSSVDISADGDVGIGTGSPSAKLHVVASTGTESNIIQATNNNGARISYQNTGLNFSYITGVNNAGNGLWFIARDNGAGTIVEVTQRNDAVTGVPSVKINGSLQATNVTFTSSRDLKTGFQPLDSQEVLTKVASLPISKWHFKEGPAVEHIGPMAEDFHAAFGLNADNKTISMTDTSGVALAAIQGLLQQVEQLQKQNAELQGRLETLEKALDNQQ